MKKTLLALALIGASATASADSWIYGGVNAGQADFGGETDSSYGVHIGTGILPFIGLEAGYQNHGKIDFGPGLEIDGDSVYFAAKPSIDFGPLHVYARGGVHSYNFDTSFGKEDDFEMMYGIGAEYFVFGPLSVGASYNIFKTKLDEDIKTFAINASLHFL
ncbi:outer membrane beta-barrel protein [Vibrio maerlii]|uniref:outer membrane beta-barrel protein n=1 Tax=Vibrio maerlii TaxID=2231648 RepID=UPI000E3D0DE7|nr:outer membrane beta-barrel protein [Vibrio maerlii]